MLRAVVLRAENGEDPRRGPLACNGIEAGAYWVGNQLSPDDGVQGCDGVCIGDWPGISIAGFGLGAGFRAARLRVAFRRVTLARVAFLVFLPFFFAARLRATLLPPCAVVDSPLPTQSTRVRAHFHHTVAGLLHSG